MNSDQTPVNHLKMPPPYWRSSLVNYQLVDAIKELVNYLEAFLYVHPKAEQEYEIYCQENYAKLKGKISKETELEIWSILEPQWYIEQKIKLKCELAIFMSSIHLEDKLNKMIVYNLDNDVAEVVEKLSPPEKLQLLAISLTNKSIKSKSPYEGIRMLTSWRNKYAHGHCTDRPSKTLRHNHLFENINETSVPKEISLVIKSLNHYLNISAYLREISLNDYTKIVSEEDIEIKNFLNEIGKYHFKFSGHSFKINREES
ncbi:hypothetical protein I0P70_03600 [Pontibacter sp. FD36]|uniref:hypothetical protein n=1 Tax=Pontibacter sp. FD36 TaxID=2789860 RepID=UPI0018AA2AC0|nr:hypothetical protein [Pontibacter sp. FD36]MBF8962322.1 hypothetical protein [Pontibacter sp. FD36]